MEIIPSFFVTGASSGVGLEATRQLARHLSKQQAAAMIYLLCRSEEKARAAIDDIGSSLKQGSGNSNSNSNSNSDCCNIRFEFLKFDACDDTETIRGNIRLPTDTNVRGILLNAGGFGETTTTTTGTDNGNGNGNDNSEQRKSSSVAKLNLIGHVVLVQHLLSVGATDKSTRIVAAGSEACFVTPGLTLNGYRAADFVEHLSPKGRKSNNTNRMGVGTEYAWAKGILALYWAAFARHHPGVSVLTVSPGAIPDTGLLSNLPGPLRAVARVSQWSCFGGSHTAAEGAKRYVDALLLAPLDEESGSFLASRRGFAGDFGNVATLRKGRFVADKELQDKAWKAVHEFLE
eukprot:jgi/Psemu1/9941/gm1.9941_g